MRIDTIRGSSHPNEADTMKKTTEELSAEQAARLTVKTQESRMMAEAIEGTGMSPWEAKVLIEAIREVYFAEPGSAPLRSGQLRYECVRHDQGAGKPLAECQLVSVVLTLLEADDHKVAAQSGADGLRRHRLCRLSEEAYAQKGLLTQEDLAQLLCADVRTVRRDIRRLQKEADVIVPTRGQQKDIGPGVTHKGVALARWLEGKDPQEVARAIHHSLHAVERYIQSFARVVFLAGKGFELLHIAFTMGISTHLARTYLELYTLHKDSPGFHLRLGELKAIGAAAYAAGDEKRGALLAAVKSMN